MAGMKLSGVQTILCLGAHADDIEIGCGGALLDLVHNNPGARVLWCVFAGEGSRESEARNSASHFLSDVSDHAIEVFGFRDSFFPDSWTEIKETISALAKRVQPDVIFTHRLEDRHQDHRVLSELTWCAFREHLILEYEIPKYEGDLGQPNIYWPLERELCDRKIRIIVDSFRSQATKPWFDEELFRSLLRLRGSESFSPLKYAEAFYCRKAIIGR